MLLDLASVKNRLSWTLQVTGLIFWHPIYCFLNFYISFGSCSPFILLYIVIIELAVTFLWLWYKIYYCCNWSIQAWISWKTVTKLRAEILNWNDQITATDVLYGAICCVYCVLKAVQAAEVEVLVTTNWSLIISVCVIYMKKNMQVTCFKPWFSTMCLWFLDVMVNLHLKSFHVLLCRNLLVHFSYQCKHPEAWPESRGL